MVKYEQQREWLEGLAKYTELKISILAFETQGYTAIDEIAEISEFKNYKSRKAYLNQQIGEVIRAAGRSDESRFYYGGMLQAVILDRLMPEWKIKAFNDPVFLDDLLSDYVNQNKEDEE